MKRTLSVIIVVIMILGCTLSVAEESSESVKNLAKIYLLYKMTPEDVGKEMIMYAYLGIVDCVNEQMTNMFYTSYGENKDNGADVVKDIKKVAISNAKVIKSLADEHIKWLNGKIKDAKYLKSLMTIAEDILGLGDE